MRGGNALCDRESEPRAFRFGREQRLTRACEDIGCHTRAVVLNRDSDVRVVRRLDRYGDDTAGGRRLGRVCHEVREELLERRRIATHA